MITSGFTLALLTCSGFYLIYAKLPQKIRKFMEKHILLTDAVACFLTYALFGGTLVALFASAWVCLMVSALLALMKNPDTRYLIEEMSEKLKIIKIKLIAWIKTLVKEHRNNQPELKLVAERE